MEPESPFAGVDFSRLSQPTQAIDVFIGRLTSGVYASRKERRKEPRFSLAAVIDVQPLDAEFRPVGGFYQVVTRDISRSGIGILDTRPVKSTYLALHIVNFQGEKLDVVAQVLRCQQLGAAGVYDIGCRFVQPPASA
jgi:hypothetical protein